MCEEEKVLSKMNKLIIFTAPSGAGKTTIVRHLLKEYDELAFSISATNRNRRPKEVDGKDYYFFSTEKFRKLVDEGAFVEWEEVYEDQYYGTLKSEVERIWAAGKFIVFDVDVRGALSIKKAYPEQSLAVFVKPPSLEALFNRLHQRKTETPKSMKKRIERAAREMEFENSFDAIVVNDLLEVALEEAELLVETFLGIENASDLTDKSE